MDTPDTAALPRIAHMPVALFSVVMGLGGFTFVVRHGETLLGWHHQVSHGLTALTFSLFVLIATGYGAKLLRFPRQVAWEFNHPLRLSFFPTLSISLILLGTLILPARPLLALVLWGIGSAVQLLFTLTILSNWMHHEKFEIAHANPAWFIPIVGNILVPIAGVPLGFPAVSWFFFSIALVFWLILFTILMNRYFFHGPMPDKLMPTLFILIAPPAVGFLSWQALHPGTRLDDFGHLLYMVALFITLLLFFQLRRFTDLPFGLPWWAYSFPMAAITAATMQMYALTGQVFYLILSPVLLAFLTLLILLLAWRTLRALRHGAIFSPD